MSTQEAMVQTSHDWQNRMRIANYVGTCGDVTDDPSVMDFLIKVGVSMTILALVLGSLA